MNGFHCSASLSHMCFSVRKNDLILDFCPILYIYVESKWSLCVVIAGWQGDAVLALLAGPGPGADGVFTQRLRLDRVSRNTREWSLLNPTRRVYITHIDFVMNHTGLGFCFQHSSHCEEDSPGGGAGAGGSGRRPRGSCTQGRQRPQVAPSHLLSSQFIYV